MRTFCAKYIIESHYEIKHVFIRVMEALRKHWLNLLTIIWNICSSSALLFLTDDENVNKRSVQCTSVSNNRQFIRNISSRHKIYITNSIFQILLLLLCTFTNSEGFYLISEILYFRARYIVQFSFINLAAVFLVNEVNINVILLLCFQYSQQIVTLLTIYVRWCSKIKIVCEYRKHNNKMAFYFIYYKPRRHLWDCYGVPCSNNRFQTALFQCVDTDATCEIRLWVKRWVCNANNIASLWTHWNSL